MFSKPLIQISLCALLLTTPFANAMEEDYSTDSNEPVVTNDYELPESDDEKQSSQFDSDDFEFQPMQRRNSI